MSIDPPEQPTPPADSGSARRVRVQRDLGRYAGLGLQFAAAVTLFALAGYWLDSRLGTLPLFLLVGVAAGFGGGMVALVRSVPATRGGRHPKGASRPPE